MPDREKVIKGLESCRYGCPGDECPYHEEIKCADMMTDALELLKEQEAAYQGAVELLRQKTILFDDAIKRLKEQEAVEPKHNPLSPTDWFCGKCGMCISRFHDYCPSCGQAVKWE